MTLTRQAANEKKAWLIWSLSDSGRFYGVRFSWLSLFQGNRRRSKLFQDLIYDYNDQTLKLNISSVFDWLMIAYIVLFSALLSRITALAYGSTWVTSSFFFLFFSSACLFFIYFLMSTEVVYLQRWNGWCHMKLQPSRRKFCVHHTTMHQFTSCKATYVRCMRV